MSLTFLLCEVLNYFCYIVKVHLGEVLSVNEQETSDDLIIQSRDYPTQRLVTDLLI